MDKINEDQMSRIRTRVSEFLEDNHGPTGVTKQFNIPDQREHLIQIGVSVLCTKWKIGYPGGSFVQAIVDNDLMESFGRADSVNSTAIKFYLSLMYNTGYIE